MANSTDRGTGPMTPGWSAARLPRTVTSDFNPQKPRCELNGCGRWASQELALDGGTRMLLCTQHLPAVG